MAITSAVFAGIGIAEGAKAGYKADKAQKEGLKRQDAAQQQAEAAAMSQRRQAEMAQAAVNKKQPNVADLLAFEQNAAGGAALTNLTGGGGAKKPGLLGDI